MISMYSEIFVFSCLVPPPIPKYFSLSFSAIPIIANTVRILNLEPRVLEFAKQGKLTEGHCKALLAITDPEKQYMTAVDLIERGTTVREIEQRNKQINQKETSKEELKRVNILYKDIENSISHCEPKAVCLNALSMNIGANENSIVPTDEKKVFFVL